MKLKLDKMEYDTQPTANPQISYLTADQLGSPRVITDGRGAVIARHDYMAYGADITETLGTVGGRTPAHGYASADQVRQQYTGYEHDDESGLDFAQARYYNASHGRFTSVDPLTASANMKDPQTFNRYSYALNSPYKFTDPLGLIAVVTIQDPPASDDGTTAPSDVTPIGDRFNSWDHLSCCAGEYAVFDSTLSDAATNVQNNVETTQVAYTRNRDNALSASFDNAMAADYNNWREPVADALDIFTQRDTGGVNADGTVRVVTPNSGTTSASGSVGIVGVGGTSDYATSTNPAVVSADAANEQRRNLAKIDSPESKQAFIKANLDRTYTVFDNNNKRVRTQTVTEKDLSIVYDAAVNRGYNFANENLRKSNK